jgi:hypothetical protein
MRPKLCAMNSIGFDLRQASPHSRGLKTILAAHLKDLTPPWLHNPASFHHSCETILQGRHWPRAEVGFDVESPRQSTTTAGRHRVRGQRLKMIQLKVRTVPRRITMPS